MIIRYTYDIHTQQVVYAICTASEGVCKHLTTSIIDAIKLVQKKG